MTPAGAHTAPSPPLRSRGPHERPGRPSPPCWAESPRAVPVPRVVTFPVTPPSRRRCQLPPPQLRGRHEHRERAGPGRAASAGGGRRRTPRGGAAAFARAERPPGRKAAPAPPPARGGAAAARLRLPACRALPPPLPRPAALTSPHRRGARPRGTPGPACCPAPPHPGSRSPVSAAGGRGLPVPPGAGPGDRFSKLDRPVRPQTPAWTWKSCLVSGGGAGWAGGAAGAASAVTAGVACAAARTKTSPARAHVLHGQRQGLVCREGNGPADVCKLGSSTNCSAMKQPVTQAFA